MGSNSLSALLNRWAESIRLFSLQNYKFVFLVFLLATSPMVMRWAN